MYILDIKNNEMETQCRKTILVYFSLSIVAIAVDKIYAIFGHGVSSAAMTWMFLYPLLGGTLLYFIIGLFFPQINRSRGYRIFYNIYNSGLAILTIGSLLKGIMEIAGTGSKYITMYYGVGGIVSGSGLVLLILLCLQYKRLGNTIS